MDPRQLRTANAKLSYRPQLHHSTPMHAQAMRPVQPGSRHWLYQCQCLHQSGTLAC